MKLTAFQLVEMDSVFGAIDAMTVKDKRLPATTAFRFMVLRNKLAPEVDAAKTARNVWVEKHGEPTDAHGAKRVDFVRLAKDKPDKLTTVIDEFNAINEQEVEVEFKKLSLLLFESLFLTQAQMAALMPFIEEE